MILTNRLRERFWVLVVILGENASEMFSFLIGAALQEKKAALRKNAELYILRIIALILLK